MSQTRVKNEPISTLPLQNSITEMKCGTWNPRTGHLALRTMLDPLTLAATLAINQ
jgi:hypothetical protein